MAEGFLKLVPVEEALEQLFAALPDAEVASESVALADALGRVVASDVTAPEDMPGFTRSSMDGYAVRAADTFGAGESQPAYLSLAGEVLMGKPSPVAVGAGEAVRISTGGLMPDGADAVVMVENTELSGSTVEVVKGVAPGDNTVGRDEDIGIGALLLARGTVLGPSQLGALAGLGIVNVQVFRVPRVGVISTGDELVPAGQAPAAGQVRDVNSAALAASVEAAGCVPVLYGIVEDSFESLLEHARGALAQCDALVISGGSSAGVRDVTVDVIAALGEPGVLAHGIYLKPGKPTLLAVCDGKPVLGLPGNPASALAVFREVMLPVLRRLRGERAAPWHAVSTVQAILERSVASASGRVELVPVALRAGDGEGLVATPIMGKSNLIGTLARADGNVRIPMGSEGLEGGQTVTVELL